MLLAGGWGPHGNSGVGVSNPPGITSTPATQPLSKRPLSGGKEETNGLIYGFVQSGKTGVLTVTGAMGADEGYRTIIILTSDNDPLYDQTLGRAQEAFPGIDIIGKKDFKDAHAFLQRIKVGTCAIVTTKNASLLKTLIENFKEGRVRGLLTGGEFKIVPNDKIALYLLRTKAEGGSNASWWPQIRFPDGRYAFAFAI